MQKIQQQPISLETMDNAFSALSKFKDPRAVEPLIRLLHLPFSEVEDEIENVAIRFRAAYLLGKIGDVKAVDSLIQALENPLPCDRGYTVSTYVAEALGELGDQRAIEPLKRFAETIQQPENAFHIFIFNIFNICRRGQGFWQRSLEALGEHGAREKAREALKKLEADF